LPTATQVLRERTQVRHLALEQASLAQDLMSPHLTVPRYVDILGVWSSAWAALEQRLWESPLAFEVSNLLPPRRAHLAQGDLLFWQQQGYSVTMPTASANSLIGALRPAEIPGLLGVCYVARGASLGSKVISGHLHKVLPLSDHRGVSFFAHEADKSLTWPQWSQCFGAYLAEPAALAQAVVWADATFAALQDAFADAPSGRAGAA
jgi:heme oxygenase